jgi:hypothetical protein
MLLLLSIIELLVGLINLRDILLIILCLGLVYLIVVLLKTSLAILQKLDV